MCDGVGLGHFGEFLAVVDDSDESASEGVYCWVCSKSIRVGR